jgi:2-dehydropantoate 2-reductase
VPRYVIYGAGAIGGAIGASLFQSGHEVLLIARGAHYDAILKDGLRFDTPDKSITLKMPVVDHPNKMDFGDDDVVLLSTKTQDTIGALNALLGVAGSEISVFCVQNGVENERIALRHFRNVYGVMIISPAEHLSPGVVEITSAGKFGIIEIGRYPSGEDELSKAVAADLDTSGWYARSTPVIEDWKYAKLVDNLSNATQVVIGLGARGGQIADRARQEGMAVLDRAGITSVSADEFRTLRSQNLRGGASGGPPRGASTWQSLVKGNPIETDYLNGEIVMLGRLYGVPTPVNELLQRLANETARVKTEPAAMTEEEVLALLDE